MSSIIRVLHLRAGSFYGGPERQLHMHALQARNTDIDITISSFEEKGEAPEFLRPIEKDSIKTHLFKTKGAYDYRAILMVREYLNMNRIHILCTHDYRTQLIGFWATRGTRVKWIAFSRGWTRENPKIFIYNLMDRIILRFADHLVAVSHSQKSKLGKLLIPDRKVSVVHNAISRDFFSTVKMVDLREEFHLPSDSIICISGGRFSHEKGTIYLAKAAHKAVQQNSRLRFLLFGNGPEIGKIRKVITKAGCADKILCPGFEKNFIGCLAGADLFVNPSLSEGLPNVVLEAMILGVPVLATSVGGVPEIIADRVNGFMVPSRNIDALVKGILFMSSNRDKSTRLADEARRSVLSRFSVENQNEKLNSIYRKISAHF